MNNGQHPDWQVKSRVLVRKAFLWCCATMFSGKVCVTISYDDKEAQRTYRKIRPLRIDHNIRKCSCGRKTYRGPLKCIAWCELRKAERSFFASQMLIHGACLIDSGTDLCPKR